MKKITKTNKVITSLGQLNYAVLVLIKEGALQQGSVCGEAEGYICKTHAGITSTTNNTPETKRKKSYMRP